MNKEKLRLAIIGAGMISWESHLPAALGSPRVKVTAIIDPMVERADSMSRAYGIEVSTAKDISEVLDQVDAVVIATPNDSHAAIAITSLSKGKAVLIEKPLAMSPGEGEAIKAAAEKSGAVLAVGYCTRFRNNIIYLKKLLDRGHFGKVRRFVTRFGSPGGWSPMSGYILTKDSAGGGVLVVTGTHFIDRMLHFWGMPDKVSMLADGKGGPEANCHCTFEYDSGLRGGAIFSKTTALPGGTVIDTESGFIMIGEFDDSDIIFRPHNAPDMEEVINQKGKTPYPADADSFNMQMDDFVSACLDGHDPMVGCEEALQSLRLIERLYACTEPLPEDWFAQEASA